MHSATSPWICMEVNQPKNMLNKLQTTLKAYFLRLLFCLIDIIISHTLSHISSWVEVRRTEKRRKHQGYPFKSQFKQTSRVARWSWGFRAGLQPNTPNGNALAPAFAGSFGCCRTHQGRGTFVALSQGKPQPPLGVLCLMVCFPRWACTRLQPFPGSLTHWIDICKNAKYLPAM